jgi:hypothetical protein
LEAESGTYQFGFNPWVRIESHLPFQTERQKVRLGHSVFSVVARLAFAAWVVYWLWKMVVGEAL